MPIKGELQIAEVGMVFVTKEWFWCKINISIEFRIMKNPYFDSTQSKIRLFNFSKYGSKYPIFQQLSQVPLQELNLNFFIHVSRDLYKHIGEKNSW